MSDALCMACFSGDEKTIELLLEKSRLDPTINYDYNSALKIACEMSNYNAVKLLLIDSRADPSSEDSKSLRVVNNPYILEMLLKDPRVDPNANNNEALIRSLHMNGKRLKMLLDDQRTDPSAKEFALKFLCIDGIHNLYSDEKFFDLDKISILLRNSIDTGIFYNENLLQSIIKETTNKDVKKYIKEYSNFVKNYRKNIDDYTESFFPHDIAELTKGFLYKFNKLKSKSRKSKSKH